MAMLRHIDGFGRYDDIFLDVLVAGRSDDAMWKQAMEYASSRLRECIGIEKEVLSDITSIQRLCTKRYIIKYMMTRRPWLGGTRHPPDEVAARLAVAVVSVYNAELTKRDPLDSDPCIFVCECLRSMRGDAWPPGVPHIQGLARIESRALSYSGCVFKALIDGNIGTALMLHGEGALPLSAYDENALSTVWVKASGSAHASLTVSPDSFNVLVAQGIFDDAARVLEVMIGGFIDGVRDRTSATACGHVRALITIAAELGADMNAHVREFGSELPVPLLVAATRATARAWLVPLLLSLGADPDARDPNTGTTAVACARSVPDNEDVVALLLAAGHAHETTQ